MARTATLMIVALLPLVVSGAETGSSSPLQGAHWRLQINGWSRHFVDDERRARLQETNTGLGLEAQLANGWFVNIGTYRDSYDGNAYYLGGGRRWRLVEAGRFHADIGAVGFLTYRRWRLEDRSGSWTPGVLPLLTLGVRPVALNLLYIPRIDGYLDDAPTLFVQASLPLN